MPRLFTTIFPKVKQNKNNATIKLLHIIQIMLPRQSNTIIFNSIPFPVVSAELPVVSQLRRIGRGLGPSAYQYILSLSELLSVLLTDTLPKGLILLTTVQRSTFFDLW